MAQSAQAMKQEIIDTLTKYEIEEVTVMLNKFKMMYINNKWDSNTYLSVDFDISCFTAKQRLYVVDLGYKILPKWCDYDTRFKYTLHLY